jgi:hypothetical protein
VLVWLDDMAAYMADTSTPLWDTDFMLLTADTVCAIWHNVALDWMERERTPCSALQVLQPGMLRLLQRLAQDPPRLFDAAPAAVWSESAHQTLMLTIHAMAKLSGAVVQCYNGLPMPGIPLRSTNTSGSSRDSPWGQGPSIDQTFGVLGAQVGNANSDA